MNDVDFPVAARPRGDRRGSRRGPRAGQGQRGRQARPERRTAILDAGAPLPRHRRVRSLHRVHGRRHDQRLADRRRRPGCARSSSGSPPHLPLEPVDAAYRGEVADALALPRRRRRDRRDLVGHAALLRRLHAARGCRPRAGSTPASSRPAGTTCARSCAAAPRTRSSRRGRRHLAQPQRPLLGAAHRGHRRRSEGRDVLHRRLRHTLVRDEALHSRAMRAATSRTSSRSTCPESEPRRAAPGVAEALAPARTPRSTRKACRPPPTRSTR